MGLFDGKQRISVAIATPWPMISTPEGRRIHEPMSPLWYRARASLQLPSNYNQCEIFADGMPVDEARNKVVRGVLDHDPTPEFLFFLDYDVIPAADSLTKLFARARWQPDYDVYCGVYCAKWANPCDPLIYTENGCGAFWDWAVGDILTTDQHGINAVHSGLTLIRTSLFRRMIEAGVVHGDGTDLDDEPWYKTTWSTGYRDGATIMRMSTEDIYFHAKAREIGCRILVDTSVLAGHLDKKTGIQYGLPWEDGPARRAKWLAAPGKNQTQDREAANGLKIALDLGAAEDRRQWPGHVTYTLDGRKESGADYVQDIRCLNLPDDHFDLVASAHTFEHVGRWEQETVWSEAFRVCKPGGAMEIIVPDLTWAAAKIHEGICDEHVMNVLYGSQEQAGVERQWNTHFFGYTPAIGRALAEQAGFTNVITRNWKDDPSLGYLLVITGEKSAIKVVASEPGPEQAEEAEESCCNGEETTHAAAVSRDHP